MKFSSKRLIVPLASVVTLMGLSSLRAAATDWISTSGTADWNTPGSWTSGVPVASGTANLTATLTGAATADLSASGTTGVLNISSGNAYLMKVTGATLTMDNGGAQAQINIGTTGVALDTVIEGVPILMTNGGLQVNMNNSGNRTISGPISSAAVSGTQTLTLNNQGSGNVYFGGAISDGPGSVVAVLVDNTGSGRTNFTSTSNTFSGGLVLRDGQLTAANMGSGLVTLGDSATAATVQLIARGGTVDNAIKVSSDSTKNAEIWSNGTQTMNLTGNLELQKKLTIHVASNKLTSTLSGDISGAGQLALINMGSASASLTVTLSGSNSAHSGGIALGSSSGGVNLRLGSATALGTGTLTIGAQNTSLDSTQANLVLTTNNAVAMNGNITYVGTGGNQLDLGTGTVTFSGNKSITVTNGVLTIGGAMVSGSSLTKEGAGTLVLNGASTYTSDTTVNAGTLRGTGSVAGGLYVNSGATLEAGNGIGTFMAAGEVGFLNGGFFEFELNSSNETYDQLVANGVTLDSNVTFTAADLGSGTWLDSTPFVIIDNTSGSAVSGTFAGLAEGSNVDFGGGNIFEISYVGGTGNDVTLTLVPEPGTWLLAMAGLALTLVRRRRI